MIVWHSGCQSQKFLHIAYYPAVAELLSLSLQPAFLPQRSLYPHNPRSISLSPRCFRSVFTILFSADSFSLECKPHNAPKAPNLSSPKLVLPAFACCQHPVGRCVDLPYWPAASGERFVIRAFTIVSWVDFVDEREVVCCKIWTRWRQAVSVISRLVHLINLSKAKSVYWLSLHWE